MEGLFLQSCRYERVVAEASAATHHGFNRVFGPKRELRPQLRFAGGVDLEIEALNQGRQDDRQLELTERLAGAAARASTEGKIRVRKRTRCVWREAFRSKRERLL